MRSVEMKIGNDVFKKILRFSGNYRPFNFLCVNHCLIASDGHAACYYRLKDSEEENFFFVKKPVLGEEYEIDLYKLKPVRLNGEYLRKWNFWINDEFRPVWSLGIDNDTLNKVSLAAMTVKQDILFSKAKMLLADGEILEESYVKETRLRDAIDLGWSVRVKPYYLQKVMRLLKRKDRKIGQSRIIVTKDGFLVIKVLSFMIKIKKELKGYD